MKSHKLGKTSEENMVGMHPDLIRVIRRALIESRYDFGVSNKSVRSEVDQAILLKVGASTTMNSRHIAENNECQLSCAVDVNIYNAGGISIWKLSDAEQHGHCRKVAQAFVTAAITEGVQIELGCLWKSFVDGPHIQLSRSDYP